jgi:hypothetical protein
VLHARVIVQRRRNLWLGSPTVATPGVAELNQDAPGQAVDFDSSWLDRCVDFIHHHIMHGARIAEAMLKLNAKSRIRGT